MYYVPPYTRSWSVRSFILPFVLFRSVTLCYPSFIKSDKATINIESTELDADYVNLHATTRKSAVDCLGVCVYFLAQMVEVNELFQGTDPPYAVRTAVCIPWTCCMAHAINLWRVYKIIREHFHEKSTVRVKFGHRPFCWGLQIFDVVLGIYY
jgi:hypothetical protein